MPVGAGSRLTHYEILARAGAGGMGEVYKARDTRLNRPVAIKILPENVAHDAEWKQRFEREAQTIASLNHPNICVLHDVGHQGGVDFLVMEFLEGQTLAQRIEKGPLSLDEAIEIAIQIADGLDRAHRSGVIHRDIKPSNVMLTPHGAKILDFGLAKWRSADAPAVTLQSAMPTQPSMTAQGTIVGTLQYMAPEQIEGEEITSATDVFAFGALLYEMVTGRRPFNGKSQASLIAAILEHQPRAMSELRPMMPSALDRLVRVCLEKNAARRWQSFADIEIQLRWIAQGAENAPKQPLPKKRTRALIAALCLLAVAIGVPPAIVLLRSKPEPPAPIRFEFPLNSPSPNQIALSPDGRSIAAITAKDGETQIWVRRLDQTEPQQIKGTDGVQFPFWSPDNRTIGFFADGKLKRVDLPAGPAQTLCDAADGRGATWNRDGIILFAAGPAGSLFRIAATGGQAVAVTTLNRSKQEIAHLYPQFLPDGKHFIYLSVSLRSGESGIFVGNLDSKETKKIVGTSFKAMYAEPGYLLFVRDTSLMAQPFDARTLMLAGSPFPIAEKIGKFAGNHIAGFSVSETGGLVYRTGDPSVRQLAFVDRQGVRNDIGSPGPYYDPAISPDGQRIAYDLSDTSNDDLWILDVARNTKSRLTFDPPVEGNPVWSPDGSQIAFASNREGDVFNIYRKSAAGTGDETLLLKTDNGKQLESWSSDGQYIVYTETNVQTGQDVWVLPLFGDRKPISVIRTPATESSGHLSPDSKWIAYAANESGRLEVYIQSFPPSGTKYQISSMGAGQPIWRSDGRELFFMSIMGDIMSVDIVPAVDADKRLGLKFGLPKRIVGYSTPFDRNNYDVTRDGTRILINVPVEVRSTVTVALNWMNAKR